ncbi:MAG TPA: hypothetical protein PKD51_16950 [Saprospiraceae bacterium]|nr:hypothetical protein [Saprospiraceae bacterium]
MENDLNDHIERRNQEYLLSKEESQLLLNLLYLDLKQICDKIEDSFNALDSSSK